ncbi:hypothetical protein KAR91_57410 [Candidatus Pacearchaeota archaeon]|nr:hypothetical protein [Candidatus Pacearchaeota archaeon]
MKKLLIFLLILTAPCFAAYLNNAFNSGELSPLIRYRVDLDRKYLGVETMENFLVKPQGAAVRRPGTLYVATAKEGDPECIENDYPLLISTSDQTALVLAQTLEIANKIDLQNMNNNLAGNYFLSGNIDASGGNFTPIGRDTGSRFTGTLEGNGFTISNLTVDGTANGQFSYDGLFGFMSGATVHDLTLTGVSITGSSTVGGLAGTVLNDSIVQNVHVTGTITGTSEFPGSVGGFTGDAESGSGDNTRIFDSTTSCTVTVNTPPGIQDTTAAGFAGDLAATAGTITITNCSATGAVTNNAENHTGGFAGLTTGTGLTVSFCFATGNIATGTTGANVGGFAGQINDATVSKCYATGTVAVSNGWSGGGFVGQLDNGGAIDNCYAWGNITTVSGWRVGGFVGWEDDTTTPVIDKCYSIGSITGTATTKGGFCALNESTITSAFWDTQTSGTGTSSGAIGKTTAQMKTQATYTDWDFDTVWTLPCNEFGSGESLVATLISFESATNDAYVLEFTDSSLRFYRNGGQIVDGSSNPYEIATVYDSDQISELQYVQSNDVMYIVHPDDPPQKLIRIDHDDWTIADVDWEWGPFLDENTTATTITPSATTGSIRLTASAAIFTADNVGSLWKIIEKSDNSAIDGTLDENESSATVAIEGDGLLTLENTWTGLVTLEKSIVGAGSWEPVYPKLNGDAANIEYAFSESDTGYEYRVTMSAFASGTCEYTLVAYNSDVAGYVTVTAFTSTTVVDATVTSTLAGTDATTKWAEGAWSPRRGYPRAICIYQNRLCLAGTTFQPNAFWTSASIAFEDMRESTLDNGAIVYEVSATKQNPILWLQDKNGVIAGTTGSVIRIFSQSNTSVLTAATIGSERQAEAGSADMQPALIGESIVFVDRNRRKVRDMVYDLQSDGFVSPELTIMAEHITDPSLIDIAVQNRPDNIVWFIRSDGQLVSLTYNRNEGVVAWARHITDGEFESVAVIPGDDEDEVWVAVKRTIGGVNLRYVEQMQPQDWGTDPNDAWFVDSALAYSGVATSTITGLDHMEGETLQAFYNGLTFENVTVASGNVTLSESVTAATIGLPYTSTFLTFPIEVQTQRGFSIGFKKKVYEIVGGFYRTMRGQYGLKEQFTEPAMYDIMFDEWPDTTNGSENPYTGIIRLEVDGGWSDELQIKFIQAEPYPFNITAIQSKITVSEN